MSFLAQLIDNPLQTGRPTLAALARGCAVAAFCIRDRLRHPPCIVCYPVNWSSRSSLGVIFLQAQLFHGKKLDRWLLRTLIACIWGILAGSVDSCSRLTIARGPRLRLCAAAQSG